MKAIDFKVAFQWLAAMYPNMKISEQMPEAYFALLKDIPIGVFKKACADCIAESNFFPTIAQLRSAAINYHPKLMGVPETSTAWEIVMHEKKQGAGDMTRDGIKVPDVHILINRAVSQLGGWRTLILSLTPELDRRNFITAYDYLLSQYREKIKIPDELHDSFAELMDRGARKELPSGEETG